MRYVYPNGKTKALTFSYDDGQIYDRKLIDILNKYNLKGTFHLNSGTLGVHRDSYEIVNAEELKTLYAGHEIACHGKEHLDPRNFPVQQMYLELGDDRHVLEEKSDQLIQGLSYPFGGYTDEYINAAKVLGFKYARTTISTGKFSLPADFMKWNPTCHQTDDIMPLVEHFLNIETFYELPLMYIWGHSFELGSEAGWEKIEKIASALSGKQDIWYATNLEVCNYAEAIRRLEFSSSGKTIYNPSAISVWLQEGNIYEGFKGTLTEVKAGEYYQIN